MQNHMVYLLMSDVIRPIKTQKYRKCIKGTEPRGIGDGEGLTVVWSFSNLLLSFALLLV